MLRHLAALLALLLAGPALAQSLSLGPPPTVEYRADAVMETEAGRMPSKIWSAKGKERRELDLGGHVSTTIVRTDRKVVWTLMPEQRMYMENAFGEAGPAGAGQPPSYDIEQTPAGEEVVNGVPCKKTKVVMTDRASGTKLGGFFWTSKDGIVVKVDAVARSEGSKTRFKLELTNLQVGPQPAHLFEIPAGWSKMELPAGMPGMGDMMKMMKGGRP
ncbi:DUF4412 domain-containing protein [Anaeromyxobacter sp. PSR-1]|uniref:DUF4412 domain-containing protein n=1 Tax=Anaeromyxobacter sp. PSR-1 TaxID=1300915 RepID=UPI0005E84A6A|nr:DUF4412 domain-containing protein [Anaeromyxobacter sp. PSR-1]GAO04419.1 hypothetical protein PSR1_03313 [Anaeromyxobacter sp. PSR-1]